MLHFNCTLLLAGTCVLVSEGVLTQTVTNCEGDSVHRLSCDSGVIVVHTALWGRADTERCTEGRPPHHVTNTDCSVVDAVDVLKTRCDGKKVCEVTAELLGASDPCIGTLKYLHTSYTCLPAIHLAICEHSLAHLQCDVGQVIFVYGADYGRHDHTTCSHKRPYSQIHKTDCSHPTREVAERCNWKNSCIIKASNSAFGDPCVGTYKYLEVAYACQNAATAKETF